MVSLWFSYRFSYVTSFIFHKDWRPGMELADPHVIAKICDRGWEITTVHAKRGFTGVNWLSGEEKRKIYISIVYINI